MDLSPVDLALRLPVAESLILRAPLPVGLLDPVEYQPHAGAGRDRLFTTRSTAGERRVVFRLNSAKDRTAEYAFVPCTDATWVHILTAGAPAGDVFTRQRDRSHGLLVTIAGSADGAGSSRLAPCPLPELAAKWDRELERVAQLDEGDPERKLPTTLHFQAKKPRDPDSFSDELRGSYEAALRYPAAVTHSADGVVISAHGQFVFENRENESAPTVCVYGGASSARVAVTLAATGHG